jgi:hypothetical protein
VTGDLGVDQALVVPVHVRGEWRRQSNRFALVATLRLGRLRRPVSDHGATGDGADGGR